MNFATARPRYLVARIGSPEAKPLLPNRPDLSTCSSCKLDVWVERGHLARCQKNGLFVVCATCIEAEPEPF